MGFLKNINKIFLAWFWLSSLAFGRDGPAVGDKVLEIKAHMPATGIGKHLSYVAVTPETEDFAKMIQKEQSGQLVFSSNHDETFYQGMEEAAFWLKLNLSNPEPLAQIIVLEQGFVFTKSWEVYDSQGNPPTSLSWAHSLEHRSIKHRNPSVSLTVAPGRSVLYMKASGHPLMGRFQVYPLAEFTQYAALDNASYILVQGTIVALLLYHLALLVVLRQTVYLYYCLFCSAMIGHLMISSGTLFFLFPKADLSFWFGTGIYIIFGLLANFCLLFSQRFLGMQENIPVFNKIVTAFIMGSFSLIFFGYAVMPAPIFRILMVTIPLTAASILFGALGLSMGGSHRRPTMFFLVGIIPSILVTGLATLSLIPGLALPFAYREIYPAMGVAFMGLFLALGIGDASLRKERQTTAEIQGLNDELRQKMEDLKELEKARTRLFQNTSHELRTPLNGIIGFVSLMHQGHYGVVNEQMADRLEKVYKLAISLLGQVNTILDLAKSHQGKLKIVSSRIHIANLVEEVKILAEGLALKYPHSTFKVESKGSAEVTVETTAEFINDYDKVMLMIRNLVGNAFKFHHRDRPNHIVVRIDLVADGVLNVQVKDTGIGISAESLPGIFDEFKQVADDSRRRYEGSGLGLAMVKALANLIGASVEVSSVPEEGSVFSLRIPSQKEGLHLASIDTTRAIPAMMSATVVTGATSATNATARAEESAAVLPRIAAGNVVAASGDSDLSQTLLTATKESAKILVVDDNPVNCEVIGDILKAAGHRPELCISGQDALVKVALNRPDLVLLDLMMPDVSGEDVLASIRSHVDLKDLPVILLTARASTEDRIWGLNLGADEYLAKPIVNQEMIVRINNILLRRKYVRSTTERTLLEGALVAAQGLGFSDSYAVSGVKIEKYFHPAEKSSGDWLFLHDDHDSEILFAMIGDVTGHGMISALVTVAVSGAVSGALASLRTNHPELALGDKLKVIAEAINNCVYQTTRRSGHSMTMAFVALHRPSGKGAYLNAGHREIMIARPKKIEGLLISSKPLGMQLNHVYRFKEFSLGVGDSIFLYTDGLIENQGVSGQLIKGRLLRKVLMESGGDPTVLKHQLLLLIADTWGSAEVKDDCSFLSLQWNPEQIELKEAA